MNACSQCMLEIPRALFHLINEDSQQRPGILFTNCLYSQLYSHGPSTSISSQRSPVTRHSCAYELLRSRNGLGSSSTWRSKLQNAISIYLNPLMYCFVTRLKFILQFEIRLAGNLSEDHPKKNRKQGTQASQHSPSSSPPILLLARDSSSLHLEQLPYMNDTINHEAVNGGWPLGRINYRALDTVFFLTALAVLSTFAAKRAPPTFQQFKCLSLSRCLVLLVLVDS